MNDSSDGKPPGPLEPEVLSLWKKVFPRLAHYFAYPDSQYTREFDSYGQKKPIGSTPKLSAKPDGKGDGKKP